MVASEAGAQLGEVESAMSRKHEHRVAVPDADDHALGELEPRGVRVGGGFLGREIGAMGQVLEAHAPLFEVGEQPA